MLTLFGYQTKPLHPFGEPINPANPRFTGNGPFPANVLNPYGKPVPLPKSNILIPPEQFWIGLNGPHKHCMRIQAGVFVGFRRKFCPQKNPWCWETVYADLNVNGNLVLHAYSYSFLGMLLSAGEKRKWIWKTKADYVVWVEGL